MRDIRNRPQSRMSGMALDRTAVARLVAAMGIAVSGGIHLRLYRDGYRDIHLDRVLGVDLSRSFALAIAVATVLSVLLVASVVWERAGRIASLAAAAYAAGALVAYALSRTVGLLGFEESRWIGEAVIAKTAELLALPALLVAALGRPMDRKENSSRRHPPASSAP